MALQLRQGYRQYLWPNLPILCCNECKSVFGLFASLDCVSVYCQKHRSKHKHSICVDLSNGHLVCLKCNPKGGKYLYNELVFAEQLRQEQMTVYRQLLGMPTTTDNNSKAISKEVLTENFSLHSNHIGLCGLMNMGATCFMNVVLQCLIRNPILKRFFLSDCHNQKKCRLNEFQCLACQMDKLFSKFFSAKQRLPLAPSDFLTTMWTSCGGSSQLVGYAQQDAHEFLIAALDLIHSNLLANDSSLGARKGEDAHACHCIIHETFAGQFQSAVTCLHCGNQTFAYDPFIDISLDVRPVFSPVIVKAALNEDVIEVTDDPMEVDSTPAAPVRTTRRSSAAASSSVKQQPKKATTIKQAKQPNLNPNTFETHTLYECFDQFTHEERLSPLEYRCGKCNANRSQQSLADGSKSIGAIKQLSIKRLPRVLSLQLKRFDHLSSSPSAAMSSIPTAIDDTPSQPKSNGGKINMMVQFPLELDLEAYTSTAIAEKNKLSSSPSRQPRLSKVIGSPTTARRSPLRSRSIPTSVSSVSSSQPSPVISTFSRLSETHCKISPHIYSLFAVIVHVGTLNSGHYLCYIRRMSNNSNNQWFCFNDHMVTIVEWEEVKQSQAYMCFYIQKCYAVEESIMQP